MHRKVLSTCLRCNRNLYIEGFLWLSSCNNPLKLSCLLTEHGLFYNE